MTLLVTPVTALTAAWQMYAGIGGIFVSLLVIALLAIPGTRNLTTEERVIQYAERATNSSSHGQGSSGAAPARQQDSALNSAKKTAANVLSRNETLESRIAHRLDGAGSELRPAEWLLLHSGIFLASAALGLLIGGGNLIIGLIFMVLGALLPWMFLGWKRKRRRKKFERSLPDTLQLMSGSLSAGLSLAQSIDTIVREGTEPMASEFKRVLVETRLGLALEVSLQGIADRFESKDFSWVVMAINIQRQVGGNLAELLNTVAGTIREREYIRRQVATLAAEGKLSAIVLGGLPPAFLLYLLVANHDYVMVLFTRPMGILMLIGGAVILSVGVFWMSRLVKVEV